MGGYLPHGSSSLSTAHTTVGVCLTRIDRLSVTVGINANDQLVEDTLGLCLLEDGSMNGWEALNFQYQYPFLLVGSQPFMEDLEL